MRGKGEWRQEWRRFVGQNQWLLWLLLLFWAGVLMGCLVFLSAAAPLADVLEPLLAPSAPPVGFFAMLRRTGSSCFLGFLLLLLLFLAGLSVCGAPAALAVPSFFGMGLGLSESYYYAQGGWGVGYTALLLLPHTLLTAAALLMACAESVRLSALLCRQLLPRQSSCGGLWPQFRLYLARFLICFALLFVAGVLDTALQCCFSAYFL